MPGAMLPQPWLTFVKARPRAAAFFASSQGNRGAERLNNFVPKATQLCKWGGVGIVSVSDVASPVPEVLGRQRRKTYTELRELL